jgi:hypothetical protein
LFTNRGFYQTYSFIPILLILVALYQKTEL